MTTGPSSTPPSHQSPASDGPHDPFRDLVAVETDVSIEGTVAIHVQPQSKALTWCVRPDGSAPTEQLRSLRPRDRLTISSPSGETIFEGVIQARFHTPDPIPFYGVIKGEPPPPRGFMIYWTPEGIDPFTWTSWFEEGNRVVVHRHVVGLVPRELPA